jgi:hypothetical protein
VDAYIEESVTESMEEMVKDIPVLKYDSKANTVTADGTVLTKK